MDCRSEEKESEKENDMYYVDEYKADRKDMRQCSTTGAGKSGLKLSVVSLGLWHNFGL